MEHRREPMGGEVDSDQAIGSDWTNNNDSVDSSNQSPDSVFNDHFVDHLTLKVRSLLSNWDECEPRTNVNLTLKEKQTNVAASADSRQLFDLGAASHTSVFAHTSNKGNAGTQVGDEISAHNQTPISNKSSKDPSLGFKRKVSSMQSSGKFFDHSKKSEDLLMMDNSASQINQLPKILINENELANLTFEASQTCSSNTEKVDTCLSYEDFSNTLQNLKDRVMHNRQQEVEESGYSGQYKLSLKKSFIFAEGTDQTRSPDSETNSNRSYFPNPSTSTHLDVRHESLENEAERSWSEITVRAESFVQPRDDKQNSLSEQDLANIPLPQGTNLRTSSKDTFTSTSRAIGVNTMASNRVSSNLIDPNVNYNSSLTDTHRIVVGSNITSSNASLNPVALSSKKDNLVSGSRFNSGVSSGNASPVGYTSKSKGCVDRRSRKSAFSATKNEFLDTVDFNVATDSRFNAGVASGSASPVEFNAKGGIDRCSRKPPFNPTSNNDSLNTVGFNVATDSRFNAGEASGSASPVEFNAKSGIDRQNAFNPTGNNASLNTVDFNSDQGTLASNSRLESRDLASNNASLNLIDLNAAPANSGYRVTATNNASLNPADCNTGYRDNLVIAYRPGLVNNETLNLMDFDTAPKDNLMSVLRSPSGVGCSASSRASMDDWRINLFDPSRNPLRDPEANYPSSDFDPTERETPPLSASSMASSRRLEWDNGADIGYSIAILNPNFQGMIPEMARSDPEGISLMNETLNVGPSPIQFPYFSFRSGGTSSPNFAAGSSQASSAADPDDNLVDKSSSPGSLSRSDSKKSVIYNSVRDMRRQSKSLSSKTDSLHLRQPFRNLSCPNLTDLRNSLGRHDWTKENMSKSEEQVGTGKAMKTFLFPGLTTQRMWTVHRNKARHADKVSQQSSSEMRDVYDRGDMLVAIQNSRKESRHSVSHACTTCQAPLSLAGDQMTSNLLCSKSKNGSEEEAFQFGSEDVEYDPVYDTAQVSQVVEWVDDASNLASDLQYVDQFSDDYPHSRPILVVSNNSSKLKGGNLSKIVGSFFDNNASTSDQSASGHSEIKPHIRWYPFAPAVTAQDIKDVSTQTAMSFVAQQLKKTPAQAVFEQQTSSPEDVTIELPGRLNFSEMRGIPGEASQEEDFNTRDISGALNPESQTKSAHRNDAEISCPDFSILSTRILNLESRFLSSGDSQQDHMDGRVSDPQDVNALQTCRSCHTDLNIAIDGSLFPSRDEHHQTLIASRHSPLSSDYLSSAANNSTVDLEHSTFSTSGRLSGAASASYSSPGDLLMNPSVPRGERKLGVGECQRMPNALQRDSTSSTSDLEGNQPRKNSMTASLPRSALQLFTPSDSSTRRNATPRENTPPEKPSNVRNLVTALNYPNTRIQRNSKNGTNSNHDFQQNSVKTAITALNTFQDSIGSRTAIPGGNVIEIQTASGNRTSDSNDFKNNPSSKFPSVSQNRFPATSTNLLDFLSQNRPFSDSKYLEQKEGIPKSYSDPLITGHDQDESSGEDGGSITFRSHVYETCLGDSKLVPQMVKHNQRHTPDVVYQENPNITSSVDNLDLDQTQNPSLYRNVSSTLQPNKTYEQKDSVNSERKFIGGGHFQMSQSTSTIDNPTRKKNRSLPGQLGSSPLFNQRDNFYGNHGFEDARLVRATQSTLSRGDNFSNVVNSSRNRDGDIEFGQSTSLNFPQMLGNARRVDNGANAGNPSLQMKGVAQTQTRNNAADFSSQLQEDSDRHNRTPLQLGSQSHPSLSMMYDTRINKVNTNTENSSHKYSSKNVSQFGEVSDAGSRAMQPPKDTARRIVDSNHDNINYSTKKNSDVHVQTHSEIDEKSTPTSHLQFLEDCHRQSQTRPRLGSKSLSLIMNKAGQETTNVRAENTNHESSTMRPENVFDSCRSQARQQQLIDATTRTIDTSTNDFNPSNNRNRTMQDGIGNKSTSFCQFEDDFPKQYPSRLQLNDAASRVVDISSNVVKPSNNGNRTIQSRIGDKSTSSCQFQDDVSKQNPQRPRSGSNSYPSLSRWDFDYAKRDPLVPNRNFVSVGIQASGSSLESEKCSFCQQSRSSHLNQCPQKDRFKVVLGQALERGRRRAMCGKSGTSFCVFSKVCFCCCNKTLQEAFNFHRGEIVDRIEARQKEVETRTGKSFFLNLTSPAAAHQQNSKQKLKPVSAKPATTSRPHSNKENIQKSTSSKQKSHLKNLNKYNRVMSKIYSQRLKSEILKGKVNFSRHEILMNS